MHKKISEANKRMLTASDLRSHLTYEPNIGVFTWKERKYRSAKGVAGTIHPHGYRVITIDNVQYPAHRLAWLYVYGEWPSLEIDHRDGNRHNNSIRNLREATQRQNNGNMRIGPRNKSGFKGVQKRKNGWEASLNFSGKYYYLGLHSTPEEASSAYLQKARDLYGEFARAA